VAPPDLHIQRCPITTATKHTERPSSWGFCVHFRGPICRHMIRRPPKSCMALVQCSRANPTRHWMQVHLNKGSASPSLKYTKESATLPSKASYLVQTQFSMRKGVYYRLGKLQMSGSLQVFFYQLIVYFLPPRVSASSQAIISKVRPTGHSCPLIKLGAAFIGEHKKLLPKATQATATNSANVHIPEPG
jgi:hypothetical protein